MSLGNPIQPTAVLQCPAPCDLVDTNKEVVGR